MLKAKLTRNYILAVPMLIVVELLRVAGAEASSCSWQNKSPRPVGTAATLLTIAPISANNVWAAGWATQKDGGDVLFEHFDGASWQTYPPPTLHLNAYAFGLSATSSTDVWSVGSQTNQGGGAAPLIMHWNGASWIVSPNPEGSANGMLSNVVAFSKHLAFAAGEINESGTFHPIVERFDGANWKLSNVFDPENDAEFQAISGTGVNDLWAGGYQNGGSEPLIEKYDPAKDSWVEMQQGARDYIYSLSARSSNDVWASGPETGPPYIEHWNGSFWSPVKFSPGASAVLEQVNASDPSGYTWATGWRPSGEKFVAFSDRYYAGKWERTDPVRVGAISTTPFAIAPLLGSNKVWVVGSYRNTSLEMPLAEVATCSVEQ